MASYRSARKLLYVVQLPPPLHGVAAMNALVANSESINQGLLTDCVVVRSATSLDDIGRLSPRKFWLLASLLFRVAWRLIRFRPHAIYLSPVPRGIAFLRDALLLVLARAVGVNRIVHMHGIGLAAGSAGRARALYRAAFTGCHVVNLSEQVGRREWSWLSRGGAHHYCVPNSLPESVHNELLTMHRNEPEPRALEILFLSTAFESKGILELVAAYSRVVRTAPDLTSELHVVGHVVADVADRLDALLAEPELSNRVILHGPLQGPAKLARLRNADIFVHPSLDDYFPLVLLEAMACGLPIIASRVGAIEEMLADGAGLLVTPGDVSELADAIIQVAGDSENCRCLGTQARSRYLEEFSPDLFVSRMRKVLRRGVGPC